MVLRFRRTMKIAPGVRLNLTKKGISARIGPRGAGITTGTSGTTVSAGIPGTGLHASKKIKSATKQRNARITATREPRTGKTGGLGFLGWIGAVFWTVLLVWGLRKLFG